VKSFGKFVVMMEMKLREGWLEMWFLLCKMNCWELLGYKKR
jgi:hypothetical protein